MKCKHGHIPVNDKNLDLSSGKQSYHNCAGTWIVIESTEPPIESVYGGYEECEPADNWDICRRCHFTLPFDAVVTGQEYMGHYGMAAAYQDYGVEYTCPHCGYNEKS